MSYSKIESLFERFKNNISNKEFFYKNSNLMLIVAFCILGLLSLKLTIFTDKYVTATAPQPLVANLTPEIASIDTEHNAVLDYDEFDGCKIKPQADCATRIVCQGTAATPTAKPTKREKMAAQEKAYTVAMTKAAYFINADVKSNTDALSIDSLSADSIVDNRQKLSAIKASGYLRGFVLLGGKFLEDGAVTVIIERSCQSAQVASDIAKEAKVTPENIGNQVAAKIKPIYQHPMGNF